MDSQLLRYAKDKKFVMIDCETFNLNLSFHFNRPWQIAMIEAVGEKIVSSHDLFLKWDTDLKISSGAAQLTRYDQKAFDKKAIPAKDAFKVIDKSLAQADYIVGHNLLGFDIYLLKGMYEYFGKDWSWITKKIIDTNCISRSIKLNYPYKNSEDLLAFQYKLCNTRKKGVKTSLGVMAKELGVVFDQNKLHDALEDLKVNFEVWNKLKWQIEL